MDLRQIAKETATVLSSYLTYQAVRTINAQLRETNPALSIWFNQFSTTTTIQDGEAYLQSLLQVNPELAFRVMTVRQHLAEDVLEFLPEMVNDKIQQANIDHRRRHLERITQLDVSNRVTLSEFEQLPSSESGLDAPDPPLS